MKLIRKRPSRDDLGRSVRLVWVQWAKEQPNPKPSWLLPYEDLSEADKEADRRIGEYMYNSGELLNTEELHALQDGVKKLARHCDECGWINLAGEIRNMLTNPFAFQERRSPYWGPDDRLQSTVEVLRCDHCGKLAVSVDDHRITSHKCAGSWTVLLSEECDFP